MILVIPASAANPGMEQPRKKVVVIGGGTGTFSVLSGLKKYPVDLTAIVAMSDSGGSTGVLRDELGVLPPGDVARCLVALSSSDKTMRALMNYRFETGTFAGHRFGNLLLSALEKMTGRFDAAVEKVSEILRLEGRVIPVTLDKVHLHAHVGRKVIRNEEEIQKTTMNGSLKRLWLEPAAKANPKALAAIRDADAIILGPGNFYASIVPNLLVGGIATAIRKSKAKKVFVCNLVTKAEHTRGYSVADYTKKLEEFLGGPVGFVIYNNHVPPADVLKRYTRAHDALVSWDALPQGRELIGGNLLSRSMTGAFSKIGTPSAESSLVRHDQSRLSSIIARLVGVAR